jgi:hypothetical protein
MTLKGQARHFFPAFRIFIFGQEVSDDVISCRINFNDSRAPSTAEFVLTNQLDRYIVDELDIHALYDSVPNLSEVELPDLKAKLADIDANADLQRLRALALDPLDQAIRNLEIAEGTSRERAATIDNTQNEYLNRTESVASDLNRLVRERVERSIQDDIKRRVLAVKVNERVQVSQPSMTQTGTVKVSTPDQIAAMRGEAYRFPFQVGDTIFHSNDPVRIFWRDPRNPAVWFYMFSGFMTDWVDDVDENNQKLVTFRCEDVLRIFRYARITTNPGIFDINAIQQVEDGVIRTFFNAQGFSGLTLPEILYTLIFGSDAAGTTALLGSTGGEALPPTRFAHKRISVNAPSTSDVPGDGVGSFTFQRSVTFVFGPDPDQPVAVQRMSPNQITGREVRLRGDNALAIYQAIIDHQVRPSDLETMVLRGKEGTSRFTLVPQDPITKAPHIEAVITEIGEHPELYPVDAGRLIMLLPASLGPSANRDLLLKDLVQSVALETTFRSRLDLIFDVLARIELSFYATPKGDLVVETPLYDFEPDDFGKEPVTRADVLNVFGAAQIAAEDVGALFDVGEERGPFSPHYQVKREDTIRWQRTFSDEKVRTLMASHYQILQGYETTGTSPSIGQEPAVTVLRSLVPQFGVRMEQVDTHGLIANKASAQIYTNLKLNQWNADARSAQVEVLPQLRIQPNRPLLFTERNYIATVRSVDHGLTWGQGGDMNMSLGVNYVRGWNGQFHTGTKRPLYATLGGFASRPLNYAILFKPVDVGNSAASPDDTSTP